MLWISIDPGKRIGWALWSDGCLIDCGTVGDLYSLPAADACIVEMPRVYPDQRKWKGDPQVIVRLAYLAGRIAERYPKHGSVEPRVWGGSIAKALKWRRTYGKLANAERDLVKSKRISEHTRDAIGIGVWVLQR